MLGALPMPEQLAALAKSTRTGDEPPKTGNEPPKSGDESLVWWRKDYDIMELAQSAGDSLRRQKKKQSNRAIGDAIALRIEEAERREKKRQPPSGEHMKNTVLKGWQYQPK